MSGSRKSRNSPLVFLAIYVLVYTTETEKALAAIHVRVKSSIDAPIWVDCKSKDDDIGGRTMHKGDSFEWHFNPKFFGGTKYWCTFVDGNVSQTVDVYKEKFSDHDMCAVDGSRTCIWDVRNDGFYMNHFDEPNNRQPWKFECGWPSN